MEDIFIHVLNISITASFLVLAIILFRLCAKKAPKWISVLLWGFVGLRLLVPLNIESSISLIPSKNTIPTTITHDRFPALDTGFESIDEVVNPILSGSMEAAPEYSANPMQVLITVLGWIWLASMICMLVYMTVSFIYLRIQTSAAVKREDNIYLCDYVKTPFILGIIRPRIYLPSNISDKDYSLVVAHEKAHLKRLDHIWKPLGFLLLSVYWFNPILWVAYILLCKDIELACDERVIRDLDDNEKASYSEALLALGIKSKIISACPLAFGEVSVKSRVSAISRYKKPAAIAIVISLIVCTIFAACFLTYKKKDAIAIDQGIWYASHVVATRQDAASCSDVPLFVFTENGDILIESRDLSELSYVRLGQMHTAYISKNEYTELLEGVNFREDFGIDYLHENIKAAFRIKPSLFLKIDAEEVYLLRSEKELFMGYVNDGKIDVLYKLSFNEVLPTYLYVSRYASSDVLGASIIIDTDRKQARVVFGNDMSYEAVGRYVYENGRLIVTTNDNLALKLVFLDVGNMLIFSEKDSDLKGLSGFFPDSTKFSSSYQLYNAGSASEFFDINGDVIQEAVFVTVSQKGTLHYIIHGGGKTFANKTVSFHSYDYASLEVVNDNLYLVCEYKEGDLSKYYYKLSFDGENLIFTYEEK